MTMDVRAARIVFFKELSETLRDRRTLVAMVLLPVCLYPLLGILSIQWIGTQEAHRAEQPSRVSLWGKPWPALDRALSEAKPGYVLRRGGTRAGLEQAVRAGRIDIVVAMQGEAPERGRDKTARVELVFDDTRPRSALSHRRVARTLRELSDTLRKERLQARGLPTDLLEPLDTTVRHVRHAGSPGGHILAGTLPLLVVLMVLLGAFYPAIDVTAGEKERGTLETLLVAPVPRGALIAGKYLVVAAVAALTGLLNLVSIGLTLAVGVGPALRAAGVSVGIPWGAIALTVAAMVPAALFFAAVMLAVASLGRSFKEAQNLLTPVLVVFALPAMAARLPGLELNGLTALLPVVNIALLLRDLIIGRAGWLPAGIAVLSLMIYTVLALRVAARVFDSETLLFAPDPSLGKVSLRARLRGGAGPLVAGPLSAAPTGSQVAVLFLVVMALIVFVGRPLQAGNLALGLLVTEWVLIGVPVLLLLRLGRVSAGSALALARPTGVALFGAFLCGVSGWLVVGALVESVQQRVLPVPVEMIREYQRALFGSGRPLALDLVVLALSPAICEELLFRGALLQATRQSLSPGATVVVNGLLFGLFHLSPYRFLSTMILGMALATVVLRTGSIWPAMLFHFLNNACAVVLGRLVTGAGAPEPSSPSWTLVAAALAVFAVGMGLVLRPRTGASSRNRPGQDPAGPGNAPG